MASKITGTIKMTSIVWDFNIINAVKSVIIVYNFGGPLKTMSINFAFSGIGPP